MVITNEHLSQGRALIFALWSVQVLSAAAFLAAALAKLTGQH